MLPISLKAKNYTSYIDETIDFTNFGDLFCIIGENGAGKSSIIDMITTALFFRARGVDSRGSGMDELINDDADQFEIDFTFQMGGNEYQIIRKKSRSGTHELEFKINGTSQSDKGIKDTQTKINNVIKIDYDTFLDTVCVGQGNSGAFMEKKPNERKEVFTQVLGLNKYEVLEKYTRDKRIETKHKIEAIDLQVSNLQKDINKKGLYEKELEEGLENVEELNNTIKDKEKELEKELSDKVKYEQMKKQRDHILNQRNKLERKIKHNEKTLDNNKERKEKLELIISKKEKVKEITKGIQNKIQENQDEFTTISNQKSSLETTNNILKSQAKELKEKYVQLKDYDKGECNFCGHNITQEYKKSYLTDLMNEGKNYLAKVSENDNLIEALTIKISELKSELNQNKKSLIEYQEKQKKVTQAETQLEGLIKRTKELKEELKEAKLEYEENLKLEVDELEERTFNDKLLKTEINSMRSNLNKWQSKIAVAKDKLEDISKKEEEYKKINKELKDLKILYDDYTDLIIAWGKKGIQAAIIENALPEIEDEINILLQLLTNGKVNIQFRTQKETKSKSSKASSIETLDIIIISENGERTYETYSGGEKFRVDFACHVGLAKFLAKRAGASIDFFIIDEGLGSQDDNAKQQFITSVKKLTSIFKQVMIITHITDMKEAFNNKVLVDNDPIVGSKVKLLN
ncbi:MAG: AAA family ATPase [archaeon]